MQQPTGLFEYLGAAFKTPLRQIMIYAYILAIVLTIGIVYSAVRFFTGGAEDQLFWGILMLAFITMQVATKLWIWMESNRVSMLAAIAESKQSN
ncbi:MAG: hypothetical protein JJU10_10870 [Idiomarina sp.]|nr:hypothetical protein [Idiomarina sp.]